MSDKENWSQLYQQQPLSGVRGHFDNMGRSRMMMDLLTAILERTPHGGRTLETGIGNGCGTCALAARRAGLRAPILLAQLSRKRIGHP